MAQMIHLLLFHLRAESSLIGPIACLGWGCRTPFGDLMRSLWHLLPCLLAFGSFLFQFSVSSFAFLNALGALIRWEIQVR